MIVTGNREKMNFWLVIFSFFLIANEYFYNTITCVTYMSAVVVFFPFPFIDVSAKFLLLTPMEIQNSLGGRSQQTNVE